MAALLHAVAVVATEETATAWAKTLSAHGIAAAALPWGVAAPPPDPEAPARALAHGGHDLVFLTSANAVRFLPEGAGRGHVAAAVGEATAEAARASGFHVVETGRTNAEDLARMLAATPPARRVLWLRGEVAREAGQEVFAAAGWSVLPVVAYRTRPLPGFGDLVHAFGVPCAWVVGSPAAAAALLLALGEDEFPPHAGGPPVVVPGEATALSLRVVGRVSPTVAASPSIDAIEAALRRYGVR